MQGKNATNTFHSEHNLVYLKVSVPNFQMAMDAFDQTNRLICLVCINRDAVLSLAATFDYVILEEKCETSRALDGFMGFYTRFVVLYITFLYNMSK